MRELFADMCWVWLNSLAGVLAVVGILLQLPGRALVLIADFLVECAGD